VRLPVGIDVNALEIGDLHLAAALARVDSHWKLSGHAVLPADLAQGRLILTGDRIDGPNGRLSADIGLDVEKRTVDGQVSLGARRPDRNPARTAGYRSCRCAWSPAAIPGPAMPARRGGRRAARANGKATWGRTARDHGIRPARHRGTRLPQGRRVRCVRRSRSGRGRSSTTDRHVERARLNARYARVEASARYDRAVDRLEVSSRCGLPAGRCPFAGGATVARPAHRTGRSQRPVDPAADTITITGGADDARRRGKAVAGA
jgi:hypothetical protein